LNGELTGRVVVVTGATSGIGLAAARAFVEKDAFVIGVGRSEDRNEKARETILGDFPNGRVEYFRADLASQAEVRELSKSITSFVAGKGFNHIDVLVNNAGGYLEKKQMTDDGIEKTFAVNHLAAFLLSNKLLPLLSSSDDGRVLTISSYSHFTTPLCLYRIVDPWPYIGLLAYKRSKLCNVLFTYELNRRSKHVTAFAVDPGLVNTSIASKGSKGISHWVWRARRKKGTPPEVPVQTILYLSSDKGIDTSRGYYFKNCTFKQPSQKAIREDLAADLWDLSCRLTGLNQANERS